jgi:hypothetical protein
MFVNMSAVYFLRQECRFYDIKLTFGVGDLVAECLPNKYAALCAVSSTGATER